MSELAKLPALRFFGIIAILLFTVGATAQAADIVTGVWISQLALFLLPAVLFARASNLRPARFLRFDKALSPAILGLIVLAAVANYFFAAGLMAFMEQVIPEHWPRADAREILDVERGARLAVLVAGVILAASVCEEAAFRGFMQQPLMARLGPWPGIALTALLFSALHMDPVGFLSRFELGLLFGWLLWRTGSLWAPIVGHAVNNGVAVLLYFTFGDEGRAEAAAETITLGAIFGMLVVGAALLLPLLYAIQAMTRHRAALGDQDLVTLEPGRQVGLSERASRTTTTVVVAGVVALAIVLASSVVAPSPTLEPPTRVVSPQARAGPEAAGSGPLPSSLP